MKNKKSGSQADLPRLIMTVLMAALIVSIIAMVTGALVMRGRRTETLSTGEEKVLDWDTVVSVPWDELVINQTETAQDQLHWRRIYFYYEGKIVKKLNIPRDIVFFIAEDVPAAVFRTKRDEYRFEYLGTKALTADWDYSTDSIVAKCYMITEKQPSEGN